MVSLSSQDSVPRIQSGFKNCPLNLLESYRLNRLQYVEHDNIKSNYIPITTGVSQGSILGPLLFIIYFNDVSFLSKSDIHINMSESICDAIFLTYHNILIDRSTCIQGSNLRLHMLVQECQHMSQK